MSDEGKLPELAQHVLGWCKLQQGTEIYPELALDVFRLCKLLPDAVN